MTLRDLIQMAEANAHIWGSFFFGLPLIALLLSLFKPPSRGLWAWFYSLLVYVTVIPGMGSAVLVAYEFFFTRDNLLDVNVWVYFVPLLSMVTTLAILKKAVNFSEVPGFMRLSGLMVIVALSFVIMIFLKRLFFGIFFTGSFANLLVLGLFVFALLQWGAYMLFRSPKEPQKSPLSFWNKD